MNADEVPYPLKEAAERFLGPRWTISSLRTEIRKGRLVAVRIAGKLAVSEKAIMEMLVACREDPKDRASTSGGGPVAPRSGQSETEDTKRALDALDATLKELKGRSPTTSQRNTRRRKTTATLIKLASPTS